MRMWVEATMALTVIIPSVGGRVDQDRVVGAPHGVDLVAQPEVPVDLPQQLRLDLGERDPGRGDVEVLQARRADDVLRA